jgi:ankyrin repeat protein
MKAHHPLCLLTICLIVVSCDHRSASDRRLSRALEKGDTNTLSKYLDSGGEVNTLIEYDRSEVLKVPLLDVALLYGQRESVAFLLKKGANPNQLDAAGYSPLAWAIGRGAKGYNYGTQVQLLEMLLKAGAMPNLKPTSPDGWPPLAKAAELGETEMVQLLLNAGADVNATNYIGQSALHLARNSEVARLLLDAGADRTLRARGELPDESALRRGKFDVLNFLTNAPIQTNRGREKVR